MSIRRNPFEQILGNQEEEDRSNRVQGIRFAEVERYDDEGYILTWLSGDVDSESAPARVASFMAGRERGAFFRPEVGDEVVVGFEDGDLDKPVILGALWSDDVDPPPGDADNSASNNTRGIVSRLGHQFIFDDTQGAGKITIKTQNNLIIVLDDQAGSITVKVDDSNQIEMSAAGVKVKGSVVTLEANSANKITIDSSGVSVVGTQINLN